MKQLLYAVVVAFAISIYPDGGSAEAYSWHDMGISGTWTSSVSDVSGSLLLATSSLDKNVYQSTDYGSSFAAVSDIPSSDENWFGVAVSGNGTMAACVSNGGGGQGNIYITQDTSTNQWSEVTSVPTNYYWASIDMSASGQYIIAPANINNVVYLSSDFGDSWTVISTTQLPEKYYNWAVVSSSGQYMYTVVGGTSGNTGTIYQSKDFGVTWDTTTAPDLEWYAITCDESGKYLVAVTTGDLIYYSLDSGGTWLASSGASSNDWHSVTSSSDGVYVAAAVYGEDCSTALYVSNTFGQEFYDAVSPVADTCWWTVSMNGNGSIVVVGANTGGLYVGTGLFESLPTPGPTLPTAVPTARPSKTPTSSPSTAPTPSPTYFPTYPTDVSAISWSPAELPAYDWYVSAIDSSGTYMAVTATGQTSSCVYLSSNKGKSWTAADVPCSDSGSYYGIAISSSGMYMVSFSTAGGIYYSNDYGASWFISTSPETASWSVMSMSSSGQYVFVVNDNTADYIYVSSDYGKIFVASGSPQLQWIGVTVCGSVVYAVSYTDKSIYKSSDNGNTWSVVSVSSTGWLAIICDEDNNGETLVGEILDLADDDLTKFYVSVDGGSSWNSISTPSSVDLVEMVGNSDLSVIGAIGYNKNDDANSIEGVYLTEDLGTTWVLTSAPAYAQYGGLSFNGDGSVALLCATSDGVLLGSVDTSIDNNSDSSLSTGAVAGIVISVLFIIAAVGTAVYFRQTISGFLFGENGASGNTQSLTASGPIQTPQSQARTSTTVSVPATASTAVQNPINNSRTMSAEQHAAGFNSEL
jgi:hypothetical protein